MSPVASVTSYPSTGDVRTKTPLGPMTTVSDASPTHVSNELTPPPPTVIVSPLVVLRFLMRMALMDWNCTASPKTFSIAPYRSRSSAAAISPRLSCHASLASYSPVPSVISWVKSQLRESTGVDRSTAFVCVCVGLSVSLVFRDGAMSISQLILEWG